MDLVRREELAHNGGNCADVPSVWRTYSARATPCELVRVDSLVLADSPRTSGIDDEYVRVLAKLDIRLPPIIVHRATMRVIDGAYRVRAAKLGAKEHIEARFFDGDERDAFVLAVEANTAANGLALSLAERKAAAARIIRTYPARSDRWVALVSGLTASTVGAIRRCSNVQETQSNTRVGRDGRLRPLDSSAGRRLAGELMLAGPGRSLRDIARAAGIAPSTVLDVRNRLSLGKDPVPEGRVGAARDDKEDAKNDAKRRRVVAKAEPDLDPATIIQMLRRDPSVRFSEAGRALLRWLDAHTFLLQTTVPSVTGIPSHCLSMIGALARHNAEFWSAFSQQIDEAERNRWPVTSAADSTLAAP